MKKAYIGYDLGDGETITDLAILDEEAVRTSIQMHFSEMEMPDINEAGKAIPTAFALDADGEVIFASSILEDPMLYQRICINFKRCPSDMIKKTDEKRTKELVDIFNAGWPAPESVPEVDFDRLSEFADAVITFTDAIFNNGKYNTKVHDAIISCDSVMFCVGHPTRWNKLDVTIYKSILEKSVLGNGTYAGKKSELMLDAESRAAFLYVRDKAGVTILPKGKAALLLDMGSSTIDITATTSDSRNHLYNSGNNYLGVRSIDFLIRDWYLEKLKEDAEDWKVYEELISLNPTLEMALTLSCRKAKETIYSVAAKRARISFADFASVRLSQDTLNELVYNRPISKVLKETISIPDDVAVALGDKTWITLFREFLNDQKKKLATQKIDVGCILLTGSASKMPFVKELVTEVFNDLGKDRVLSDMNPSRSISMGLALVGPNDYKAREFSLAVEDMIRTIVPKCIDSSIGDLADSLSKVVENVVFSIVMKRMKEWKEGKFTTLNSMTRAIENDCSKDKLDALLRKNEAYNKAISDWVINKVGADIAIQMKSLCQRFGVTNITVDQLNVFKIPSVKIEGLPNPTEGMLDTIMTVVSLIAGVITYIVLPTVIGVIIGLIALISGDIALLLLGLLLAIPEAGLVLLIAIAGVAVVIAIRNGMEEAKKEILNKIQQYDLPGWSRKLVSDEKVVEKLNNSNIRLKIKEAIMSKESKDQIISSVTQSIREQIEQRMEVIKYLIK